MWVISNGREYQDTVKWPHISNYLWKGDFYIILLKSKATEQLALQQKAIGKLENRWHSLIPSILDLCLRHNYLPFSCFLLLLSLITTSRFIQAVPRTKEQLTEIPPDGNIWKAIQRGFKAISCSCSHREIVSQCPRFYHRYSKHLLFYLLLLTTSNYLLEGRCFLLIFMLDW